MSTFRGEIREFPGIAVDYFENSNEDTLYFLSHCHTDHMVGIGSLAALQKTRLILSSMSKSILTNLYPDLEPCLEVIGIGDGQQYTLANGQHIHCTALPAGHCPGSVMFYFQETVNVLYTGDFRWKASDLKQLKILQTVKKDLHSVYLDSTFLLPEYNEFPAQKESVAEVEKLTKRWLEKSPKNRVFLQIPARFGSEFLLLELYKRLKVDMHLSSVDQGCLLPFIPEMRHFIVPQLNDSVMVVVGMRSTELNPRFQWRTIRPSAMYWTNWRRGDPLVKQDGLRKELFRVCYSSHSSASEIVALLELLQPKITRLNVNPDGRKDRRYEQLRLVKLEDRKGSSAEVVKEEAKVALQEYSLAQGFIASSSPPEKTELFKKFLKEIRDEDSDEEEASILILPIRKKIKVAL